MKSNTLFFLLAITISLTAKAQINKNNWLVGGDIAFSYSKSKPESTVDSKTFNLNASPNVGYFFWNKLAFGARFDYTLSRTKNDSGTSKFDRFLLSPFARYYFLNTDKMANPFLESSYRFSLMNENNSKEFSAKGGIAIFLNSSVAFEISLNYLNSTTNNTTFVGNQTLLLGFGIQVHLEKL
ncbi:MAG: outer membrane beta-barrel protein [Xanthomarina gelatinilytica]|uniref:outer membrane beta-barrel protein n=1 Tax=Xanthomarina gelatinilytica TaxID=1137281 RepID=UPI003A8C4A31